MKKYAYGVGLYKIENNDIKILLCKSISSLNKWGCLKGVKVNKETPKECAKREFTEECGIKVKICDFEEYFEQINEDKDVGIWLMNTNKIKNIDQYFNAEKLLNNYLSWENSKVKFYSLSDLPQIKKKQNLLLASIKDFLQNKHQYH